MAKRYLLLFGLQTLGAVIFFWNGVPLYREVIASPSSHEPRSETLVWVVISTALIQVGYWASYRTRLPVPQVAHALLGHVLQFLAQMSFVFAGSVFGFVFITKGLDVPVFGSVVLLMGLFSLYCYTRELGRLGNALD